MRFIDYGRDEETKQKAVNFKTNYADHNEILNCYCIIARVPHKEN